MLRLKFALPANEDVTTMLTEKERTQIRAVLEDEQKRLAKTSQNALAYSMNHERNIGRDSIDESMEEEIFSEALFSAATSPWVKLIKMYIIYQNGEACVACPITCTEGLVEILKQYADTEETRKILRHCQEGIDGQFAIGAQYLSEIQGGSDVPANVLEAVQEDGQWRLYGNKFFCSATHADYALVTAKPVGSEKVGIFVLPSDTRNIFVSAL
jgi:alkylation response protein AidB-like acyl-CoA dehydrogenase